MDRFDREEFGRLKEQTIGTVQQVLDLCKLMSNELGQRRTENHALKSFSVALFATLDDDKRKTVVEHLRRQSAAATNDTAGQLSAATLDTLVERLRGI